VDGVQDIKTLNTKLKQIDKAKIHDGAKLIIKAGLEHKNFLNSAVAHLASDCGVTEDVARRLVNIAVHIQGYPEDRYNMAISVLKGISFDKRKQGASFLRFMDKCNMDDYTKRDLEDLDNAEDFNTASTILREIQSSVFINCKVCKQDVRLNDYNFGRNTCRDCERKRKRGELKGITAVEDTETKPSRSISDIVSDIQSEVIINDDAKEADTSTVEAVTKEEQVVTEVNEETEEAKEQKAKTRNRVDKINAYRKFYAELCTSLCSKVYSDEGMEELFEKLDLINSLIEKETKHGN
jgi:hypothetical protein